MLTNAEIIILSMQYSREKIRTVLHDVLPDGSNIEEVSAQHNISVEAIAHWYERSERIIDAYDIDHSGFVLADILD